MSWKGQELWWKYYSAWRTPIPYPPSVIKGWVLTILWGGGVHPQRLWGINQNLASMRHGTVDPRLPSGSEIKEGEQENCVPRPEAVLNTFMWVLWPPLCPTQRQPKSVGWHSIHRKGWWVWELWVHGLEIGMLPVTQTMPPLLPAYWASFFFGGTSSSFSIYCPHTIVEPLSTCSMHLTNAVRPRDVVLMFSWSIWVLS